MADQSPRFNDGAGYERMMGVWSRMVGEVFLDWLAPAPGLRWVDVGCGNGAFTELLAQRCAPAAIEGIDPSEAQIAFASGRPGTAGAHYRIGGAEALPYADASFDAATMALVIFFVPNPPKGVAEMVRVVRPGGLVAAYAWDMQGGGFPVEPLRAELRALGRDLSGPPSPEASRMESLRQLWTDAGIEAVETREITVRRGFADFDEFWSITALSTATRPILEAMGPAEVATLKDRVRGRLPADAAGRIAYDARANAIKGRVRQ